MDTLSRCLSLGQSGFRFNFDKIVVYIDPYLSDNVAVAEGDHLKRLVPVKIRPEQITDAHWVLITHIHMDHCDMDTLRPIYTASPNCRFVGPAEVCQFLLEQGFSSERIVSAPPDWLSLGDELKIHATPAAHPTIKVDKHGNWNCIGYIIDYADKRIYHAGDTFVVKELIDFVSAFLPIETVLLPVNEHNYFREQLNIIGNMGIRDAFGFTTTLKAKKMIPMHWDMFSPNAVFREEIELLYKLIKPPFELIFDPEELWR
jgi:L-ascorbate 6-phosphate lactonase